MKHELVWIILIGCLGSPKAGWAGQEEVAVEKAIAIEAQAAATFSETKDKQAVLSLYSKDYMGIQDGETEAREDIERWLSDYEAELNKGSSLRFISAVSNVRVQVTGPTAWAIYDYVFQAVRKGELEAQDSGKCTSLLRKEGSAWLVFHEHCSKTRINQ